MAVTKEELAGSPTFTYNRKGGEGQQVFKIAWTDLEAFVEEFMPASYLQGTTIVVPPAVTFPSVPWLPASSINIEPWDPESPLGDNIFPAQYEFCKVTVTYSTEEYAQRPQDVGNDGPGGAQGLGGAGLGGTGPNGLTSNEQTFISHKVTIGGEFLTWPNKSVQWEKPADPTSPNEANGGVGGSDTKVPEDARIAVPTPLIEHHITFHFVPFPPWQAIRACAGHVNAYTFVGALPETLLFLGCEASRETTTTGTRAWTLAYKFAEKNNNLCNPREPWGWNHFLRTDGFVSGTFCRMNRKPPGGQTILKQSMTTGATGVSPVSKTGFPQGGVADRMIIQVDTTGPTVASGTAHVKEYMRVIPYSGTILWATVDRGLFGTSDVAHQGQTGISADHIGGPAKIFYRCITTLSSAMDNNSQTVVFFDTADDDIFPEVGQMLLLVGTELMCVWNRQPGTYQVLRGIRGYTPIAHSIGEKVELVGMPIFPLQDFRSLFMSGLQTG